MEPILQKLEIKKEELGVLVKRNVIEKGDLCCGPRRNHTDKHCDYSDYQDRSSHHDDGPYHVDSSLDGHHADSNPYHSDYWDNLGYEDYP